MPVFIKKLKNKLETRRNLKFAVLKVINDVTNN